jgi:hypothetical protein
MKYPSTARACVLAAVLALIVVTACAPAPTGGAHDLVVSNQTTLAVTLAVNGAVVRTIQPHTQDAVLVRDLLPQPWIVEARTSSGRLLSSMTVRPGDVWETSMPDGSTQMKGDAVRVDLSCGRLDMWSGPPLAGPPPGPGAAGDCAP